MKYMSIVVLLVMLGVSAAALSGEIPRLDLKMVCYDRVANRASVFPNGIDGRFYSTFEGLRDSSGWIVYDKWYRVFESYMMPESYDHSLPSLDSVLYLESACRILLISPSAVGMGQITWAAKRNQSGWSVGPEEARAMPTDDLRRWWPIASEVVSLRSFGITDRVRPYSLNTDLVSCFHNVPDTVLPDGSSPSRFTYLTISYSVTPSMSSPSDTLFVDVSGFPSGCSHVLWTPSDVERDDFPIPAAIAPLTPESTRNEYCFDAERLGLPPGDYDVEVVGFDSLADGVVLDADVAAMGSGWSVGLQPADQARGANAVVVRAGGQVVRVVGMDPGDRLGWMSNLVEIPPEGEDQ
jgi:hypothetical protein